MRTGIATVCLAGTLREKMQACAIAGFDGIEIFEQDLVTSPLSPEDVRKLAADLGLSLDLYQPFRDFDSVSEDLLAANLRRADAKFRLMSRLGMHTMLLCSNVGTATIDDDQLRAAQLSRLAELAGEHGVRVAYEALAWGKYVNDYEHAHRLVDMVDHPNLGTCLDSFHILSRDWDTAPIEAFNPEKIFFVQVADAPKLSMDVLSWSRHYRVFPGEGQFELAKFMGHVVRAGYAGPVSLEVFNDVFRQSDVERTAVDAMRSLIWLEEQSAPGSRQTRPRSKARWPAGGRVRRPADRPGAATPWNSPRFPGWPNRPVSTSPRSGQGLRRPGNPARPAGICVQRAASHQERAIVDHGPRPRDHQRRAVRRRRSSARRVRRCPRRAPPRPPLLFLPWASTSTRPYRRGPRPAAQGPRGAAQEPGQRGNLPGLRRAGLHRNLPLPGKPGRHRGLDAGIRRPSGSARSRPAGGTAVIDHVNLAQPWQHFDEAVLFYTSALALEPQPYAEVASPTGLVRSQVMLTQDRGVRLVLNLAPLLQQEAAGTSGTAVSRQRTYQEHVAFAVDDLVATARAARDRGLDFLQIPANYYEDLDARFGLDAGIPGHPAGAQPAL